MENPIRLLIVDDQQFMRQSLKALLSSHLVLEELFMATNGIEALRAVEASNPNLIIMDAHMPEMDGIQATRMIKIRYPQIKVAVLSLYAGYREAAMAAGADAFFVVQEPVDLLLAAEAAENPSLKGHLESMRLDLRPLLDFVDRVIDKPSDQSPGNPWDQAN